MVCSAQHILFGCIWCQYVTLVVKLTMIILSRCLWLSHSIEKITVFPIVKHKWFKTMQVSCLSSNFWSLILIPLVDLTWNSYYAGIPIVIFYFSIPAWLVGIFHKKEVTFLLFPIYLFQYGIIFILFMGYNSITPTIFASQSAPVWGTGRSFSLAPVSLCFPFFFFNMIQFSITGYSRLICHFFLTSIWNIPLLPGLFYWQIGLRNQDPRQWYAHCYWGVIASRPSLLTKLRKYLCIY